MRSSLVKSNSPPTALLAVAQNAARAANSGVDDELGSIRRVVELPAITWVCPLVVVPAVGSTLASSPVQADNAATMPALTKNAAKLFKSAYCPLRLLDASMTSSTEQRAQYPGSQGAG